MPYIKQFDRAVFDSQIESMTPTTPGELNYVFTKIAIKYFNDSKGNYQSINDILGALQGAGLEFYRRKAAPYEDEKIKENGDVY